MPRPYPPTSRHQRPRRYRRNRSRPNSPKSSNLTGVVQSHRGSARPAFPSHVAHRASSTIRSGWVAGARCPENGPVRGPDAMRRSREARPVRGPGWVSRPAACGPSIGGLQSSRATSPSAPGRPPPSGHLATPLPRSHARAPGSPAPSGRSCRKRRACRHLCLAQLQPGVLHGTGSDQQGRCGHGTSTCPCCWSPMHDKH